MQTWKSRLGTPQHTVALCWRSSRVGLYTRKPIPAINPNPQAQLQLLTVPFCEYVCTRVGCIQSIAPLDPVVLLCYCRVALPEGLFLGETLHATLTQELTR